MSSLRISPNESNNIYTHKIETPVQIVSPLPPSVYEKLRNKNKVDILKYQIKQNKACGENIFNRCHKAIGKAEIAAFDSLLADYLLLGPSSNEILRLINNCSNPPYNLFCGDSAEEHAIYLHNQIIGAIDHIQYIKESRPQVLNRTPEIYSCLRDKKHILDNEYSHQKSQESRPYSRHEQEIKKESHEPSEQISKEFTQWINENLSLTSKNKNAAELRAEFCKAATRYQAVAELKESVEQMKNKEANDSIDFFGCGLEPILKSPFLSAVKSNYRFLRTMLVNVKEAKSGAIPKCHQQMNDLESRVNELKERYANMMSSASNEYIEIEKSIKNQKDEIVHLHERLDPAVDTLLKSSNDEYYAPYQSSAKESEEELYCMAESEDEKEILDLLSKLRFSRKSVDTKTQEVVRHMIGSSRTRCAIYKVLCDSYKNDEREEQIKYKHKAMQRLEKNMKSFRGSLNVAGMKRWNADIDEIGRTFDSLQELTESLKQCAESVIRPVSDVELAELEARAEALVVERGRLDCEIAEAAAGLDAAVAELAGAAHGLAVLQQGSPECRDAVQEREMVRMQELVLCPSCHENRRNCLLPCLHPVCKKCLKRNGMKCPICGEECKKSEVKPFYFQN